MKQRPLFSVIDQNAMRQTISKWLNTLHYKIKFFYKYLRSIIKSRV